MSIYVGTQNQHARQNMTPTHGTVINLVRRVEGVGHKLFMDRYFSSPTLFDDLFGRKINACGTVRHNRQGLPRDIGPKFQKLRRGDIVTRVRGRLTVVRWKDKRDVYLLTNMHPPPAEGRFLDDSGNVLKPRIVEDYNTHMGYVDKSDRMANSYNFARKT